MNAATGTWQLRRVIIRSWAARCINVMLSPDCSKAKVKEHASVDTPGDRVMLDFFQGQRLLVRTLQTCMAHRGMLPGEGYSETGGSSLGTRFYLRHLLPVWKEPRGWAPFQSISELWIPVR